MLVQPPSPALESRLPGTGGVRGRNQGSSAIARTAWPAQELAGAVQGAPASDPKPDSFSAALRE